MQSPAIQEPIFILPAKNNSVIITDAAQFGISPTKDTINGSKKPVDNIKTVIASSPTNSTKQPNIILIINMNENIFNECIKG